MNEPVGAASAHSPAVAASKWVEMSGKNQYHRRTGRVNSPLRVSLGFELCCGDKSLLPLGMLVLSRIHVSYPYSNCAEIGETPSCQSIAGTVRGDCLAISNDGFCYAKAPTCLKNCHYQRDSTIKANPYFKKNTHPPILRTGYPLQNATDARRELKPVAGCSGSAVQ